MGKVKEKKIQKQLIRHQFNKQERIQDLRIT